MDKKIYYSDKASYEILIFRKKIYIIEETENLLYSMAFFFAFGVIVYRGDENEQKQQSY
jgi:uncharacterized Rmd1/YagE family protein